MSIKLVGHLGATRNDWLSTLFLIIGFLVGLLLLRHCFKRVFLACLAILAIYVFFGWLLIHLFIFSSQFELQLKGFQGLRVRSFLAAILGLSTELILTNLNQVDKMIDGFRM